MWCMVRSVQVVAMTKRAGEAGVAPTGFGRVVYGHIELQSGQPQTLGATTGSHRLAIRDDAVPRGRVSVRD